MALKQRLIAVVWRTNAPDLILRELECGADGTARTTCIAERFSDLLIATDKAAGQNTRRSMVAATAW